LARLSESANEGQSEKDSFFFVAFPLESIRSPVAAGRFNEYDVICGTRKGTPMSIPRVAIIGRPNVGKSSLLNWLAHKRISVVDPMAGVTRDRVTYLMHVHDRYFELVDTGGIGIVDRDDLTADVDRQIQIALDEADLILFVVDGPTGICDLDQRVADRLRRIQKPKVLVVNKCDSPKLDAEISAFYGLTDGPLVITSVISNRNQDQLLKTIVEHLPPPAPDEAEEGAAQAAEPELKLAIVGRRNVGKSTFINQLAQTERMIVSEIPGTTRDSVDVRFQLDGKSFVAIDTPGVRKRKSLANNVEWYGLARAKRSIRRANVVLMFFDATEPVSRVDKQLVSEILDEVKPCIFVVNKWDLVKDKTTEAWSDYLFQLFAGMRHVPVAFLTAKTGRNVQKVINLAQSIYKQARYRVPTGELNRLVKEAVRNWPPPMRQNRTPRIKYAVQVATEPPTIVLKCNDAVLFDESWKRYLLGFLREHLPFKEVPVKVYYRSQSDQPTQKESREEARVASELDGEESAFEEVLDDESSE
jgi:GTP-binding protein